MQGRDPNIVTSGLSGRVERDGIVVQVQIYRLETSQEWVLEVVNAAGTSVLWNETFLTDDAAYEAFEHAVEEEGMRTFLDSGRIIPFPR